MEIKARRRNLKEIDRTQKKMLLQRGLRCRRIDVLVSTEISDRGTRRDKAGLVEVRELLTQAI